MLSTGPFHNPKDSNQETSFDLITSFLGITSALVLQTQSSYREVATLNAIPSNELSYLVS